MKNQPLKFFKPETIKGRYNFKLLQKHTAVGLSDIFKFEKFIHEKYNEQRADGYFESFIAKCIFYFFRLTALSIKLIHAMSFGS